MPMRQEHWHTHTTYLSLPHRSSFQHTAQCAWWPGRWGVRQRCALLAEGLCSKMCSLDQCAHLISVRTVFQFLAPVSVRPPAQPLTFTLCVPAGQGYALIASRPG
jgi:hypothetical protein